MSDDLFLARRYALSLARSLMVCVTLFHSTGGYGAMPSAEFDGDVAEIVHVYDPFDL